MKSSVTGIEAAQTLETFTAREGMRYSTRYNILDALPDMPQVIPHASHSFETIQVQWMLVHWRFDRIEAIWRLPRLPGALYKEANEYEDCFLHGGHPIR